MRSSFWRQACCLSIKCCSAFSIEKQQEAKKWRGLIAPRFIAPNDHRSKPTIVVLFVISTIVVVAVGVVVGDVVGVVDVVDDVGSVGDVAAAA